MAAEWLRRWRSALAAGARLRHSRWLGLGVVLLVAAFWLIFLGRQVRAVSQFTWQIRPLALALSLIWAAVYSLSLALCWTWLLRRVGAALPYGRGVFVWQLSMFSRYVPGNVWHIFSRMALGARYGVQASQVFASAALEQALNLIGALVLTSLLLPFTGEAVSLGWMAALVPVGLALLHPRLFGWLLRWAAAHLKRPELAWPYHYRDILAGVVGYAGAMTCSGLALYTVAGGLTTITLTQLPVFLGASALAWAMGYLSFLTPSGLGVREGVVVLVLSTVVPLPVAVVSSLLYRLALTAGELFVLAVGWLLERGLNWWRPQSVSPT